MNQKTESEQVFYQFWLIYTNSKFALQKVCIEIQLKLATKIEQLVFIPKMK